MSDFDPYMTFDVRLDHVLVGISRRERHSIFAVGDLTSELVIFGLVETGFVWAEVAFVLGDLTGG